MTKPENVTRPSSQAKDIYRLLADLDTELSILSITSCLEGWKWYRPFSSSARHAALMQASSLAFEARLAARDLLDKGSHDA